MIKSAVLFFGCFLLGCFGVIAQNNLKGMSDHEKELVHQREIIQIEREIKASKEDTTKVLLSLKLSFIPGAAYEKDFPDIINQTMDLSKKLNYPHGIAMAIFWQGEMQNNKKDYPLALKYYRQAAKIAEAHRLYGDLYCIYNTSLNLYYYQADYISAMAIAQKGLTIAELLNDKEYQAHYNNQIGFIYLKQEKPDEALKYYRQYLIIAAALNNSWMVADACNEIADSYLLKTDYKTAIPNFFKALSLYYKMPNDTNGNTFYKDRLIFKMERIIYTLDKISKAYKLEGNYKSALYYSQLTFYFYKKNKGVNKYDLAGYYINAGDLYRALHNYSDAGQYLYQGLWLAKSIMHREDIRDAYGGMSQNFAAQRRYDSAYFYHVLYTGLKDSIINEKVSKEINSLEVERRGKEIALLTQQGKLKETEISKQNLDRNFIIGSVTLIAVILYLLLYIKSSIKQQKLVSEKQSAVHEERQRISSDMHDDIGTGLSTMLLYINMLKIKLEGSEDGHNIDRISALGDELVSQMKEIVWALSPGNDKLDSLLLFMRQYFILLFEPLGYECEVIFPAVIPDVELEGEIRRNIFLCFKEALNNVIKHAHATRVELQAQLSSNKLSIQVKDNGCGIPPTTPGQITGNGLKNISRRTSAIKGNFNFFNDNGTVIQLEIAL